MSISTSRVMEYDPFSQEFQADPFPVYRWMRDEAPVFYSEKWNWWALSRFEDVRAAATDPQTFLSYEGIDIDDTAKDQSGPGFLPDIDNPRHDQIRRMIQPQLPAAPHRRAGGRGPRGGPRPDRRLAAPRGTVDLAQELAWPTPNEVFFDLLGLPAAERRRAPGAAQPVGARAQGPQARRLPAHPGGQGRHRRHPGTTSSTCCNDAARRPRDDLVTHIVTAEIDGVPFAEEDFGARLGGPRPDDGAVPGRRREHRGAHRDAVQAARREPGPARHPAGEPGAHPGRGRGGDPARHPAAAGRPHHVARGRRCTG